VNVLDAAARGTSEGLQLMLNVIAMLISFIALIALVNGMLAPRTTYRVVDPRQPANHPRWIFYPVAWVMGVPGHDTTPSRAWLGTRMVLNEFIALRAARHAQGDARPGVVHHRDFAAVRLREPQLGGHPDRRHRRARAQSQHDLAKLGFRAMIAGTLANFLSATLAGMLL